MHNQPLHTTSVNHIVGRLLQLWRAESPLTLAPLPVDVMGSLQSEQEEVESRLIHANKQAPAGSGAADLQRKLDLINEYLDNGKRLEATLTGAVEARRQDNDTGAFTIELHVEENDPYQYQQGFFTTTCIYDWASEQYGIEVPEWAPAQLSAEVNAAQDQTTNAKSSKYTDLEREKHDVLIAVLLEDLAKLLKGQYIENGHPNYTQLGERIAAICTEQNVDISGMSKEKLRKKFSHAMKTKERCMPARK